MHRILTQSRPTLLDPSPESCCNPPVAQLADGYRLQYDWHIKGSVPAVFHYLSHVRTFPLWWRPVFLDAQSEWVEPCLGATATVRAKSFLPYVLDWKLVVTELEPPHFIALGADVVLGGKLGLTGSIAYRLVEENGTVHVITDQFMRPNRPLPPILRGLAGRLFRFNHAWAMKRGEIGLQRIVGSGTLPG